MAQLMALLEAYGVWGLLVLAFVESSFFPVPPDVLLLPMSIAQPQRAILYAALCTFASVAGAYLGYVLGHLIGQPLLNRFASQATIGKVERMFRDYGMWAVVIAGLTPIPYKVFTISAGCFSMNVPRFLFASVIGRGMRFFLEAIFIIAFGQQAIEFLSRNFSWITIVVAAMLILIWWIYRRLRTGHSDGLARFHERLQHMGSLMRHWHEGLFSIIGEWVLAWGVGAFLIFFLADIAEDMLNNELHRSDQLIIGWLSPWIGGPAAYLAEIFSLPVLALAAMIIVAFFLRYMKPRAGHFLLSLAGAALIYWGYSGVLYHFTGLTGTLNDLRWQGMNMTLWASAVCAVCGGIRPVWSRTQMRWWILGLIAVVVMAFAWILAGQTPSEVFVSYAAAALWMVLIWLIVLYQDSKNNSSKA